MMGISKWRNDFPAQNSHLTQPLWVGLSSDCSIISPQNTLHRKPYFIFPDLLKRWSFKRDGIWSGIWSFLYYRERWYFFFPKIWSYPLDGKSKMIFLKKIHKNMIFSSNVLKRWSFQKGPPRYMIFLVLSGKMVFLPEKMIFFPWTQSERWSFSRNTWNMTFSVYTYQCYRRGATPLYQKKSKLT